VLPSIDTVSPLRITPKSASMLDRLLLLSLLLLILLNPILDRSDLRKLFLTGLTFTPVILATIQLSEKKYWVWPSTLLMSLTIAFGVGAILSKNPLFAVLKWSSLAAFFGLSVIGLFSYLRKARVVQLSHLYTCVSVYLLIGMFWFALYAAIDAAYPGSFQHSSSRVVDRESEMLYFSLVTLSTVGYGDIVPLADEARMLAALEAITGVIYIAISVAILVSAFRRQEPSPPE